MGRVAFICIECVYSLLSSALETAVEVPLQGMYSVWTHGTSDHCDPFTASPAPPSPLPISFVGLSPASPGTPPPGER